MKNKFIFYSLILAICLQILPGAAYAQDIVLPAPDMTGGKPLMQALRERQSIRIYKNEKLTQQQISDLLWAAWGINRPDEKKRTAPSGSNRQEIDVYVALKEGLYLYVAESHMLKMINDKDLRGLCGDDSVLNLVYVADMEKLGKKEGDKIEPANLINPHASAAFISQNVYLYCASAGLGTVVRGSFEREKLFAEMGLRSNQRITYTQSVGIPE
jgi:nitroreductase